MLTKIRKKCYYIQERCDKNVVEIIGNAFLERSEASA